MHNVGGWGCCICLPNEIPCLTGYPVRLFSWLQALTYTLERVLIILELKEELMKMIARYIDWEKKQINWWKKTLGISDHGVAWISFIKGMLVGGLAYHFLISS